MTEKLDRLLSATVQKLASRDPTLPVDVVITPGSQEDVEAVIRHLEEVGGTSTEIEPGSVYAQVPSEKVHQLAQSPLISGIRLARVHRMH